MEVAPNSLMQLLFCIVFSSSFHFYIFNMEERIILNFTCISVYPHTCRMDVNRFFSADFQFFSIKKRNRLRNFIRFPMPHLRKWKEKRINGTPLRNLNTLHNNKKRSYKSNFSVTSFYYLY